MESSQYVYFMNSDEYVSKTNEVEAKLGRRFVVGNVIVKGVKKNYAIMSTTKKFLSQYPDAKLIAEGYKSKMQYTEPTTENKRGN